MGAENRCRACVALELVVLERAPARALDRVAVRVEGNLAARRVSKIDGEHVGQANDVKQHVSEFERHLFPGVGRQGGGLLGGEPLKMFDHLARLAGDGAEA